jgi:hypothetical protein
VSTATAPAVIDAAGGFGWANYPSGQVS